jgi:trans-2,3-dihydro-3-hydroxyanthranilate isomerase
VIKYEYYVVDAFTPTPFLGNPAGVVLRADELSDELLKSIAAEIHLSETAFVLRPHSSDADIRIRWFTPEVEVKMCGHATLATAHILRQTGQWADPRQPLRIETLAGVLCVEIDRTGSPEILWLHMPAPKLTGTAIDPTRLAELCGLEFAQMSGDLPIQQTQDQDLIVPVKDFRALQGARPDFGALGVFCRLHCVRGVCLTTPRGVSAAATLQSRFFAPAVGIDEDPVTGSVHGPLAAYAVLYNIGTFADGEMVMDCLQTPASGRVGQVRIRIRQDAGTTLPVKVGGQCLTTMHGQVTIE